MKLIEDVLNLAIYEMNANGGPVKEVRPNEGPQVNKYLSAIGLPPGNQWCAAFVYWLINYSLQKYDIENPLLKSGYCPHVALWGQEKKIYSLSPERGDIFYVMDNHPAEPWYHTGLVMRAFAGEIETIEGNASPDGSANGDGIYIRRRPMGNLSFVKWWKLVADPEGKKFKVFLDGKELGEAPIIENQSYLPVRLFAEKLKKSIKVDNAKKQIFLI